MCAMLLLSAAVLLAAAAGSAFRLDPQHAVVVPSPASPDLLFGYSVALTRSPAQLLVGEPKGPWFHRPEIHEPGVLYRCPLLPDSRPRCAPVTLDQTGNEVTYIGGYRVQHLKNDSMFASTIVTTSGGMTLVCGPGWKNQLYSSYNHYLMNGLCYSLSSDRLAKPDAPLVENEKQGQAVEDPAAPHKKKNVFYYAFGEAGFSAHVSEEAGKVLLGAPGVYSWRGSAVRYRINEAGRLVEMFVARPDTLQDYGYFGYSVTAGRFMPGNNRPGRVQYAAGAPRASDTGKVFLFDLADGVADSGDGMAVLQELSGEQLGEYFGAAVLAEDVTGDGLADLLVGAPQHTTAEAGDAGRVYVFLNLGDGQLQRSESPLSVASREGESQLPDDSPQSHGARFGYALASAGDSNEDGYNDVWVGAPYEDDGRGAVYLFLGSPSGLRAAAAQRVAARDVHRDLRSFGFSMSATADVDGNGYSDLAVGAPLAGHAVVLLARPTARLTPRLTASISELSLTATSFVLSVCLQYASRRAQVQAAAAVLLSLEGPSVQLERAALQAGGAAGRQLRYTQPLQLGRLACANVTVLIRPGGREGHAMPDYTTPIDITMRFNLSDEASRRDRPFCSSCPVLDPTAPTAASLRIPYATGCANDSHCRPDLKVTADWGDTPLPLVLGSSREVTLRAVVLNLGEPAFLARLVVSLPAALAVARMPAACHVPQGPPSGAPAPSGGGPATTRLLCHVAHPLGRNQQHELELPLDVSSLSLSDLVAAPGPALGPPFLLVGLSATSAAEGPGPLDTAQTLKLPLAAVVDLDLVGRASPELGLLPDQASTRAVGFTHTYEVRHVGPTRISHASLRLLVPAKARVRGALVPLLMTRVLVDRRRVECTVGEVTQADAAESVRSASTARPGGSPGGSPDAEDWEDVEDSGADGGLRCGRHPVVCVELLCPLPLLPPAATTVDLRLRLLSEDLRALGGLSVGAVTVHTKAMIVLDGVPLLPPGSRVRTRPAKLSTLFMRPSDPAPVQPWVMGLSAAAGLLLLLILSLALKKAGFFGRKKVPPIDAATLEGLPGGPTQKAAGSGPSDDDSLLAEKKNTTPDEEVDVVMETASDSWTSTHSNRG